MTAGAGKRILVLGATWPPETFLEQLFRGLAARGHRLTFGARTPLPSTAAPFERLPLADESGGLASWAIMPRLVAAALRRPRAAALLLGERPSWSRARFLWPILARRFDLIYLPWLATGVDLLPLFELETPILVSCRGAHLNVAPHNPERAELTKALPEIFQKAAAVHCVSQAMFRRAQEFGLETAAIIRPAVDLELFSAFERQIRVPTRLQLLSTGSLIWRKGLEDGLRAVAQAVALGLDLEYTIVGDGPDRERLLFAIRDLGLEDRARLVGRLTPAEVREQLRRADIFLLPSLSEGISNAALEAMAMGLAVIATAVDGMPEAIVDQQEGLLVPARAPEELAAAIARLATDEKLRTRLGRAARARVERDFRLEDQIDAFDALIAKVAA